MPSIDINPIIPGFAPDPSVVLVNGTFFLVNSTFHLFPGLPIYASKDLTSWKHIGNAIHRQNQLSLAVSSTKLVPIDNGETMLATGGLYAPTIRYHNGTFYVVCTNIIHKVDSEEDKTENFIVSTCDIWSEEWSDPVYFDFHGIDPSLLFDDDGKVYVQASASPGPMTKIHLFEIDLKSGEKLSPEKKIWDGTGGIYPEGPHIYKKDNLYYLMISEGGTYDDHMITVARSTDIWGPYEACAKNPILTARGTDNYIQNTGHCDFFQDQQERWWAVCLGVRKDESRFNMGRETFLTSGQWLEGEWPSISEVNVNPVLLDGTELLRSEDGTRLTTKLMVDYLYIRDAQLGDHKFSDGGSTITLTASKSDISQCNEPVTFVGKRQRKLAGKSTVSMKTVLTPSNASLKAGLAYYKDEHRYIKLFYDFSSSAIVFEVVNNAKSISRISQHEIQLHDKVVFRVEYTEQNFQFSYKVGNNSEEWSFFEGLDTIEMTGIDFVGPIIGIFATADVEDVEVRFNNLAIDAESG